MVYKVHLSVFVFLLYNIELPNGLILEISYQFLVCSELGAGVILLTTSWTYYFSHHVERYKSVLYFREQQHEIVPPLAPGACSWPPFPSDLTCFTLCEVLYFQLYKAISSLLSTVLGYTYNMMHFSSSLLNIFLWIECPIWYCSITHLTTLMCSQNSFCS